MRFLKTTFPKLLLLLIISSGILNTVNCQLYEWRGPGRTGIYNEKGLLQFVNSPDNIIAVQSNGNDIGLHPTQKPIKLMELLIEMTTTEGQIVCDPFSGSGTTLVAALKMKRQFIGYENNAEYYKIACERIQNFKKDNVE